MRHAPRIVAPAVLTAALVVGSPADVACAGDVPVVRGWVVRQALERAATERVDVVGISDSNQLYQGYGWDHGFHVVLAEHFDMYATGLLTQGENGSNGRDVGYRYGVQTSTDWRDGTVGTHVDAPAEWEAFCAPYAPQTAFEDVHDYTWSGPDVASATTPRNGIKVFSDCPIDPTGRMVASICSARFTEPGDGGFVPAWLVDGVVTAEGARVETEGQPVAQMALSELDLPADPGRAGLDLVYRWHLNAHEFLGRVFTLYLRVENADRAAGFSYSTWGSHGGESSRYVANLLVNGDEGVTDTYKQYYLQQVRRLQLGQSRRTVIFWIDHGLNDRNETLPSVGPLQIADGSSAAAYADNLQALITQITTDWVAAGGAEDDVYFVLDPSHPITQPDDEQLEAYREAARCVALANPRTAFVDVSAMISAYQMLEMGYYDILGHAHLTPAGYEGLTRLKIDALLAAEPACAGDADADGGVGVGDLLTVLGGWGTCPPECAAPCTGDVDGDRDVGVADLLAVLADWNCG